MDIYFVILTCLLLAQMSLILVFLNPAYDVRKITQYFNSTTRRHRTYYLLSTVIYFGLVIYIGMYTPLMRVIRLIINKDDEHSEYKAVIIHKVEKTYIMAGFSLFLYFAAHGITALISYAAHMLDMTCSTCKGLDKRENESNDCAIENVDILPYLLRMKRSVHQNAITVKRGQKEFPKIIPKDSELQQNNNEAIDLKCEYS